MAERIEDTKGRMKEAAGDLTDDDDLKREGKIDQASASAKDAVVLLDKNLAEEKEALRIVERIATRVSKEKVTSTAAA